MPSVWRLSCHFLFQLHRSVPTGDRTPISRMRCEHSTNKPMPRYLTTVSFRWTVLHILTNTFFNSDQKIEVKVLSHWAYSYHSARKLTFTFLSFHIVSVSYQVFRISYREAVYFILIIAHPILSCMYPIAHHVNLMMQVLYLHIRKTSVISESFIFICTDKEDSVLRVYRSLPSTTSLL